MDTTMMDIAYALSSQGVADQIKDPIEVIAAVVAAVRLRNVHNIVF